MTCTSTSASVTHECALETHEPTYVPRAAKPFFIPIVYSPPGAVGHVAALEFPLRKVEPRAVGHMAAPDLTSSWRQGLELRDT
jgi:hypothetical protein